MVRRISSPVFVGREPELARVASLRAETVASGDGVTLLISGEAGVGKSRFSAELASRAAADGWTVLRGSCDEFGAESRPFAALREMAPAIEAFLTAQAPTELVRPPWLAIARLVTGEQGTGGSLFQLVPDLFRRMAAVRPLFIAYDDLHWADESSRVLFEALGRGLRDAPVILAGCYRGNEVGRGHPLRPVLAAVHRQARPEVIELPAFEYGEARAVAAAIAGEFDPHAFDSLYERSGGNAFLLEELLASPGGELPQAVKDVVLARLDALSADAARLAEVASLETIAGREVLAEVAQLAPARLAAALDELSERGFLHERPAGFAFRHPLLREVIYSRIPPGRRLTMHSRMAEAMERHEPHRPAEAARHWREASTPDRELSAAVRAGNQALGAGAMAEAALAFERALDLLDAGHESKDEGFIDRIKLVTDAALALYQCRRLPDLIRLLCVELARARLSADRAMLGLWLAQGYRESPDPAELAKSVSALREAAAAVDATTPQDIAVLVLSSASVDLLSNHGLDREAATVAARIPTGETGALTTPGAASHDGAFAVSAARGWVALALGRPVQEHLSRATAHAGSPMTQVDGPRMLRLLGPHERNIQEAVPVCDRLFDEGFGPMTGSEVEWAISRSFARLGRYAEGLQRLYHIRERTGDDDWLRVVTPGWGLMMARTGNALEGAFMFEPDPLPFGDILLPSMWGEYASARVEFARASHEHRMARETVNAALPRLQGHLMATGSEAVAYAVGLEADHAFGHRGPDPEALALADDWIAHLQACIDDAPGRVVIDDLGMFIEQARAERARLAGDDSAVTWEALAARWEAMPRPSDAAYCRFRAAYAFLTSPATARNGARARAVEHLHAGLATCREIGAVVLEAEVTAFMRTAGIRESFARPAALPALPAANGAAHGPALTDRELAVLRLLAQGESNGRIALRLGISTKTASVHVSNILRKLDAANRVEAAVRAEKMGLV
jgi:DNA-binding CsgD family transcriptional regulator